MFLDEAKISVKGGDGGRGCVAWRREKYVSKGGPSGGDGGDGGNVVFQADNNTDTLTDYASRKKFAATHGGFGLGSNMGGKDAEDLVLVVPPGTVVTEMLEDGTTKILADLRVHGDRAVVAHGGRAGFGNAHFASSVRQRPDFAELGEPGEEKHIHLELKLVADVGIIGFPNAGKSTLISVISAARPKIANYAFTTLVPNLGVVKAYDRAFVVCDIPGLIEGASEGKGLGHQFLRHVERCGVLVHLLDCSHAFNNVEFDPKILVDDYQTIRKELKAYSPTLEQKRELVFLNKVDLLQPEQLEEMKKLLKKKKITIVDSISAATQQGTDDLVKTLLPIVLEEREKRLSVQIESDKALEQLPVLQPQLESKRMHQYVIEQTAEGVVIRGDRLEQFAKMTNFGSDGAMNRFHDVLDRVGIMRALKRLKLPAGTPISIGTTRIEDHLSELDS